MKLVTLCQSWYFDISFSNCQRLKSTPWTICQQPILFWMWMSKKCTKFIPQLLPKYFQIHGIVLFSLYFLTIIVSSGGFRFSFKCFREGNQPCYYCTCMVCFLSSVWTKTVNQTVFVHTEEGSYIRNICFKETLLTRTFDVFFTISIEPLIWSQNFVFTC